MQEPTFTADGFEMSAGVNHLSHFLLANLLLEDLAASPTGKPRCVIVGSGVHTATRTLIATNHPPTGQQIRHPPDGERSFTELCREYIKIVTEVASPSSQCASHRSSSFT